LLAQKSDITYISILKTPSINNNPRNDIIYFCISILLQNIFQIQKENRVIIKKNIHICQKTDIPKSDSLIKESEKNISSIRSHIINILSYKRGSVARAQAQIPKRNCFRETPKCLKLLKTYIQKSRGRRSNTPEKISMINCPNTKYTS
jgi:hypothetical protein